MKRIEIHLSDAKNYDLNKLREGRTVSDTIRAMIDARVSYIELLDVIQAYLGDDEDYQCADAVVRFLRRCGVRVIDDWEDISE